MYCVNIMIYFTFNRKKKRWTKVCKITQKNFRLFLRTNIHLHGVHLARLCPQEAIETPTAMRKVELFAII